MSDTPFRDTARKLSLGGNYARLQVKSDGARSFTWWRNLVEYGPWGGEYGPSVGPPKPDAVPGIAKLFRVSEQRVREMIAEDWFGVNHNADVSQRVMRIASALDSLSERDADLVADVARRLASDGQESQETQEATALKVVAAEPAPGA